MDRRRSQRCHRRRIALYPVENPQYIILSDPGLLDLLDTTPFYQRLDFADRSPHFPRGGLHLNLPEQTIEFWFAEPTADLIGDVRQNWPGWTVVWHRDQYEKQLEATGDALQLNRPTWQALLHEAAEFAGAALPPIDTESIDDLLEKRGGEITWKNPLATPDGRLLTDEDSLREMLDFAVAQVLKPIVKPEPLSLLIRTPASPKSTL